MSGLTKDRGPSEVYAFIDEQEQSIEDGFFFNPAYAGATEWGDLPADWHNQGTNLSFLDGHVAHHRWGASKTFCGHRANANDKLHLEDQRWLRERLPTK